MSKVGISFAEKRLLEHLRLGGSVRDEVGRDLVHKFVQKAWNDSDIHRIAVAEPGHGNRGETPVFLVTQSEGRHQLP